MIDLVPQGKYKGFPKSLVPVFARHPELFRDIKALAERGVNLLDSDEYGQRPKADTFVRIAKAYRKGIFSKARFEAELTDYYLELVKWTTAKLYFQEVGIPSGTREYLLSTECIVTPADTYEAVRILEQGIRLLEEVFRESIQQGLPCPDRRSPGKDGDEVLRALSPGQKAVRYFDTFSERRRPAQKTKELRPAVREGVLQVVERALQPIDFEAVLESVKNALGMPGEDIRQLVFQTLQESTMPCIQAPDNKYVSFESIFTGMKFRVKPTAEEIAGGYLLTDKHFPTVLLNPRLDSFSFVEPAGTEVSTLVFEVALDRDGIDLRDWFSGKSFSKGDDAVLTISNYRKRIFMLDHERAQERNEAWIGERNSVLADIFVGVLRGTSEKRMFLNDLLPRAYAGFPFSRETPPDHWSFIAKKDPRLEMAGWEEMKLL